MYPQDSFRFDEVGLDAFIQDIYFHRNLERIFADQALNGFPDSPQTGSYFLAILKSRIKNTYKAKDPGANSSYGKDPLRRFSVLCRYIR